MNREIPGFYYDPEKKKYFRIQANHAAPESQYSRDSVKRKRKEHEKHERRTRFSHKVAKEKIRKTTLLSHPLIGIERETGTSDLRSASQEHHGLAYASQMRRKELHRFEPWPSNYSIKHVLRDTRSGTVIASGHRGCESSVSVCFPDCDQGKWTYNHTMERVLFKAAYRLSSLSLSHTGYLLATMDCGPKSDSYLAPRMLPAPDERGDYRWPPSFARPIRIRTSPSLWCSSACPTGQNPLFAIGTSDGLHTLEGAGSHWTLSKKPFPADSTPVRRRKHDSSHILISSVEWLSPNVIASGMKDSSIFLHDIRSGGSAMRLQHSHAVAKIRAVDPYRLVVGGHDSLQMYDVRYPVNGLQRNPNPVKRHHTSTTPYLSFSDYSPTVIPDFDLSSELGLLASASEDNAIQLFSLQTGKQVPSSSSPVARHRYPSPISSLCFEPASSSPRGPMAPSLLVCVGGAVDEWNW